MRGQPGRRWIGLAAVVLLSTYALAAPAEPFPLDAAGARWVDRTLKSLTLDEKIGQLIVPAFYSSFVSTDSDAFDQLATLVRDYHVGGFHVFGARQLAPSVLLDPHYGTVILGEPLDAASLSNRLQALSRVPLLNTADFETGLGFRLAGATTFPHQMAMGAIAGDDAVRLVRAEARITATEARAVGVSVNFAPIADVNDNPRNPVINTRSYGEDPARVAALVAAYVEGARDGGMIATIKHFPGHGDTEVDSHIGLPIIPFDRARLDRLELVPFRRGIAAGAQAVMAAHIELPAIDPTPSTPATFSSAILKDLLRHDLGFRGLTYTDAMDMEALTRIAPPDEAAVRAVVAGADQVLFSPDPVAAFKGLKAAVASGRISRARLDDSVERVLRAKAFAGVDKVRTVPLEEVAAKVGARANRIVADEAAARSITLAKDDRSQVPLSVPRDTPILYLSVVDYPSGWQIAAPSRTFIPELKKRWPQVTAIEVSDHTPLSELDLVRGIAPRYGAVIASVFVRATSGSGRLDLAADLARFVGDLARQASRTNTPFITVFFGNPYVASFIPDLPAVMLTYDFYDLPELAAVRAIAGEAPISGRLPITLSAALPVGRGLDRHVARQASGAAR
jgi:beta-N-acetylhexosaminidase